MASLQSIYEHAMFGLTGEMLPVIWILVTFTTVQ